MRTVTLASLYLFFPHVEKRKFMIGTSRDEEREDLPSSTLARSPVPECISAYKFDALSACGWSNSTLRSKWREAQFTMQVYDKWPHPGRGPNARGSIESPFATISFICSCPLRGQYLCGHHKKIRLFDYVPLPLRTYSTTSPL